MDRHTLLQLSSLAFFHLHFYSSLKIQANLFPFALRDSGRFLFALPPAAPGPTGLDTSPLFWLDICTSPSNTFVINLESLLY